LPQDPPSFPTPLPRLRLANLFLEGARLFPPLGLSLLHLLFPSFLPTSPFSLALSPPRVVHTAPVLSLLHLQPLFSTFLPVSPQLLEHPNGSFLALREVLSFLPVGFDKPFFLATLVLTTPPSLRSTSLAVCNRLRCWTPHLSGEQEDAFRFSFSPLV